MKKIILYLQWTLVFSLGATDFISLKTFAYAEDSVTAFQQEIVYAKQKHDAIVSKMNDTGFLMDQKKNDALEKEAVNLLEELATKGHPSEPKNPEIELKKEPTVQPANTNGTQWSWATKLKSVLMHDRPVKEVKLEPMKGEPKRPTAVNESGDTGWFWRKLGYRERQPTDGEMLYKVAVSDNKITLKEAISIAEANNITLKALQQRVEAAKAKLLEAKRAFYPTVQAVVTANGGLASQIAGNDPHGRFYEGQSRKINVSQPLFYGGELQLTVKQAEANVKSSESELKKSKGELIYQVKSAYYGAVKAEYNLQYQMDAYKEVNEIHDKILKGYKEKSSLRSII